MSRPKRELVKEDALLTPASHTSIINAIKVGNYIEVAAALAGVSSAVFKRWMRQGVTDKSGKFYELHRDVEQALAASEVADLAVIKKAANTQWQAAAWRLERRYKDRWGRNVIEVTGKDGGAMQHEHVAIVNMISKIYGKPADDNAKRSGAPKKEPKP